MKKGFTIIELLAIFILLSVIALITVPIVKTAIDASKDKSYENQIKIIKKAASNWAINNTHCLPDGNDTVVITLLMLKNGISDTTNLCYGDPGGYIDVDIKNPKTGELFDNGLQIKIQKFNNSFVFNVIDEDIPIVEPNPTIVLNGTKTINITKNSPFVDPGVTAKTVTGDNISDVLVTYVKNGVQYDSVDTTIIGTYTITYSVTSNNKKVIATRTVNIY